MRADAEAGPPTVLSLIFLLRQINPSRADVALAPPPRPLFSCQIDCKLVGVPPGMSATRKICYIHMAAGAVGGLVIAVMAIVANAFDVMFMADYGISAGCTGVLLMTNLFVSVMRKVRDADGLSLRACSCFV